MSDGLQRPRIPPTASAAVRRPPTGGPRQRALRPRSTGIGQISAVGTRVPGQGLRPPAQTFTGGTPGITYDAQGVAHPTGGSFLHIPEVGTTGQGGNAAAGLAPGTVSNAQGPITAANPANPAPGIGDSIFAGQAATLFSSIPQQRAAIEKQGAYDLADFNQGNALRARQAALAGENADYSANSGGNFYSGQLGKAQGLVRQNAMEQQAGAQNAFNRQASARQAALDAVGTLVEDPTSPTGYSGSGGAMDTLWGYYTGAAQRRLDANQGLDPGATAPPPAAAPTPTQAAIAGGTNPGAAKDLPGVRRLPDGRIITARSGKELRTFEGRDSKGRKGIRRYYPDGRSTFVRTG